MTRVKAGGPGATRAVSFALVLVLSAAGPARGQEEAEPEPLTPQFSLHGFTDVIFSASWSDPAPVGKTAFALGQFDLFMNSLLTENISFLGEVVFELEADRDQSWVVDVERVIISYTWSDYLRVSLGRVHTPLGYWNEAYHHGAFLQPTVQRPEALKFEDDGGILPVHAVGFGLSGAAPLADWELRYVGVVANGRGRGREIIQSVEETNSEKAFAAKLSLAHPGAKGVLVGPALYLDRIPPDPGVPGREGEISETIVGGHLAYQDERVLLLAELFAMHHDDRLTAIDYDHLAGYSVLVVELGNWNPYAGIDWIDFDEGDPYFAPEDSDITRYIAGLRYDLSAFSLIRAEYRHDRVADEGIDVLAIQVAFTF